MVIIKYYSETTKKIYESVEALQNAEKQYNELLVKKEKELKKKKERAEEIEKAFYKIKESEREYLKLKNAFVKDFGCFHFTFRDEGETPTLDFHDIFDKILRNF